MFSDKALCILRGRRNEEMALKIYMFFSAMWCYTVHKNNSPHRNKTKGAITKESWDEIGITVVFFNSHLRPGNGWQYTWQWEESTPWAQSWRTSSQRRVAAGPRYWLENHLESNFLVSVRKEKLVQAFFVFLLPLALTKMRTVMKFPCAVPQKLPFLLKDTFLPDSFDLPCESFWFRACPMPRLIHYSPEIPRWKASFCHTLQKTFCNPQETVFKQF